MIANPKYVTDGFTTLLGGVDESRAPLLLGADQVSRAINITFRGGFPKPRPAILKRALKWARGEYGNWFQNNRFQGADRFDDFLNREKLVASVGGRIFLIDPTMGYLVTEITPRTFTTTTANFTAQDSLTDITINVNDASKIYVGYPIYIDGKEYQVTAISGTQLTARNMEEADGTVIASGTTVEVLDPNNPNQPNAWFVQAEQYFIIQDNQGSAIIFDGATTRRALPSGEIPSGGPMAYGRGRIWVAVNDMREFVAGDIAGGPTGVLGFTENTYLSGGGTFRIGSNAGKIRAMQFIMQLDTSLGQGPLQIFCDRAIYSVNAPTQRDLWAVVTNPIQTESLINFGATAQASTILINGDVFFRAEDGLRSFIVARRDFGTWGNTPISREMNRILDKDTPELLLQSCATMFDNRLLFTASPAPTPNGVHHRCLVALDFDLISTLKGKMPPAYDGIWTGLLVTGLVSGKFTGINRCFAFAHNAESGINELWEITKDGYRDNDVNQVNWVLETRSMTFPVGGQPSGLKGLATAEVWVQEFIGECSITLQYRPDQHPCWQDWDTKEICIVDDQCAEEDPCASTTAGNMHGYKTRIGFGQPGDSDNEADEKAMLSGFSFQVRLEGTGWASLNMFRAWSHIEEEYPQQPPSDSRSECNAIACCPPNPFEYQADCGELDSPSAQFFTELNADGEYGVTFFVVEGRTYTVFHADDTEQQEMESFTATETGMETVAVERIADIGDNERVWYTVAASGDCPARTSPEVEIPIVY